MTILIPLASSAGAFTTNVAPAISVTGVVIAALISVPLKSVDIWTALIATLFALRSNCSFCVVLNAGKFVAPTILAFVKLAPATVAPEKFTLVSVAPASDTLVSTAFANDEPVKFRFARLVVTVCPARLSTAPTVTTHVTLAGAL